jgi:hypothetical protein
MLLLPATKQIPSKRINDPRVHSDSGSYSEIDRAPSGICAEGATESAVVRADGGRVTVQKVVEILRTGIKAE